MVKRTAPQTRFWRHVKKGSRKECWPWIGNKSPKGYGRFAPYPTTIPKDRKKPKVIFSHRLAWEYTHGPIPKGLECCHHCDNRPCCNPAHLFVGTHKDNMDDAIKKGRLWAVHGERQGSSKLTDKKIVQIRSLYLPGVVSMLTLAKMFGVSERSIWMIVHRKGWKHVP